MDQRLKFAHARGARIQVATGVYPSDVREHGEDWFMWVSDDRPLGPYGKCFARRVHPDDEHLQYGHLSKALRDSVIYGEVDAQDTFHAAMVLISNYMPPWFIALNEDDSFLLNSFKLDFAEMLADEGL